MDFDRLRFPILLRGAWFGINRLFREKLEHSMITPVQYTVLRNLCESDGSILNQQHLANLLYTNKNNLTDLLNRMEKSKLVRRHGSSNDNRKKKVEVTKKGRKEFVHASDDAGKLQADILSLFSKDQKTALFSYFSRCNDKLDELD